MSSRGRRLACVGCHEQRDTGSAAGRFAAGLLREPSKLTPGPDGCWPLRFDQLVQPVLDRHCVSCHKPGVENAAAAAFDLTPAAAYKKLLEYADGDLRKLAFERDRSIAGQMPARNSKLYRLLTAEPAPLRGAAAGGRSPPPGRMDGHLRPAIGFVQRNAGAATPRVAREGLGIAGQMKRARQKKPGLFGKAGLLMMRHSASARIPSTWTNAPLDRALRSPVTRIRSTCFPDRGNSFRYTQTPQMSSAE